MQQILCVKMSFSITKGGMYTFHHYHLSESASLEKQQLSQAEMLSQTLNLINCLSITFQQS